MPFRSFLLLVAINVIWALNVVMSKVIVTDLAIPPIFYSGVRSALVMVLLVAWLRPIPDRPWRVAAITLAISGGAYALFFMGLTDASPSAASVVNLAGPPLTVLFAIVLLGERVGWRRGVGIGITFVGVVIAVADPSGATGSAGLILIAGSAAVGALGMVLLKTIDLDPLRLQAWAGTSSALVLLPLSAITETGQIAAAAASPGALVAALLFSAVLVSIVAHTAFFRMLQLYDANLLVPLTLMTPIFTIIAGALITGDEIGIFLVIGAAIALAGVLVILLRPSREFLKPLLGLWRA